MFSQDLIRAINDDRERSIVEELRRRSVSRGRQERWVRPPKQTRPQAR